MRIRKTKDGLTVQAIAGTRVVLFGMDISASLRKGLLGFTILRTGPSARNPKKLETRPLKGGMHFEEADIWYDVETRVALTGQSDRHPIQAFLWGDYAADPGTRYVYDIIARYGKPGALTDGAKLRLTVSTEAMDDGQHAIYFNRGVAGSQYYARTFADYRRFYKTSKGWQDFIRPEDVPERRAFEWLSRGLEEAMLDFIAKAKDSSYAIRGSAYEFTYRPVMQALVDALERGVDVQMTHHDKHDIQTKLSGGSIIAKTVSGTDKPTSDVWKKVQSAVKEQRVPDSTAAENAEAIRTLCLHNWGNTERFDKMMISRKHTKVFSHNKFLILLKDGKPLEVFTGSTNFTNGGIFGQSNVGHVVRDTKVAQKYLEYWQVMSRDPKPPTRDDKAYPLGDWTVKAQPDMTGPPPPGVTPVFSPRSSRKMLDWYAEQFRSAKHTVHFTAAFTVAQEFYEDAIGDDGPEMRYLILDKFSAKNPPAKIVQKHPGVKPLDAYARNRVAWGDTLSSRDSDKEDVIEVLTGYNTNVNFLHTKFMLIDPLTDDPVVITGSANFSKGSTTDNDENMLIIRGNTRVADVFLGEFMRLFNHFRIRNEVNAMSAHEQESSRHLKSDDSWIKPYFEKGSQLEKERRLFANAGA